MTKTQGSEPINDDNESSSRPCPTSTQRKTNQGESPPQEQRSKDLNQEERRNKLFERSRQLNEHIRNSRSREQRQAAVFPLNQNPITPNFFSNT